MALRPNLSKWHVLIVDDDAPSAEVEADLLRVFKANVYVALSGSSALAMLAALPKLTTIVMDLKMPEMSGWQLLKQIRNMPDYSEVPIVAVTACAMPGDREHSLATGFDGYIAKPVNLIPFWWELGEIIVQKHSV